METKKDLFKDLKIRLAELSHLGSGVALLHWDHEVYMPQKGAEFRAKTIANLVGIFHEKLISKEMEKLLKELAKLEKK